jgi:LysR family glycine cleavage system transcriptional activator
VVLELISSFRYGWFQLDPQRSGSAAFKKSVTVRKNKIVSDFPLIVHETRPKAWNDWSRSSGIELPADVKVTRLGSMIAVVRAAEQGIGAALVPVPLAEQWFKQGTIVRLFQPELVSEFSYFLVSREGKTVDNALETLRAWILERFAAQP